MTESECSDEWYLDNQIGRIYGTILRVEPDILDAGIYSSRCFAFIELDNGEIIFVWWKEDNDWRERIGTRQLFNIYYEYYADRIDILPTPRFGVESVWTARKDEIYKKDWEILPNGLLRGRAIWNDRDWEILPNGQVREWPIVHKRGFLLSTDVTLYGRIEALYEYRNEGNMMIDIGCGTVRMPLCVDHQKNTFDEHGKFIPYKEFDRIKPGSFVKCLTTEYHGGASIIINPLWEGSPVHLSSDQIRKREPHDS